MIEQVTSMLSEAIRAKLAKGPRFRFDGSLEDAFDREVYLDDFIPLALEEFAGLYEQIIKEYGPLSAEDIDMELFVLTKKQLQLY